MKTYGMKKNGFVRVYYNGKLGVGTCFRDAIRAAAGGFLG